MNMIIATVVIAAAFNAVKVEYPSVEWSERVSYCALHASETSSVIKGIDDALLPCLAADVAKAIITCPLSRDRIKDMKIVASTIANQSSKDQISNVEMMMTNAAPSFTETIVNAIAPIKAKKLDEMKLMPVTHQLVGGGGIQSIDIMMSNIQSDEHKIEMFTDLPDDGDKQSDINLLRVPKPLWTKDRKTPIDPNWKHPSPYQFQEL